MPYTYLITCIPTGQRYYGSRYAKRCTPSDLGTSYFSSSREVHRLIKEYGVENFTFEIRKVFNTKEEAIAWEFKVLRRLKADKSSMWLNKHNGDGRVNGGFYGRKHSPETIEKMRQSKIGIPRPDVVERNQSRRGVKRGPHSKEHKRKIGESNRGKKKPWLAERNRTRAHAVKHNFNHS